MPLRSKFAVIYGVIRIKSSRRDGEPIVASARLSITVSLRGDEVKKTIIAGASALALLAGLFVAVAPANAAVIRVPKTAMQACAVANGIYCVESLTLTDSNGRKIPLVYVPSGQEVPQKKTPADFYAPVAKIVNGKVVNNNWWMSQYQRDVLTSGKMVVMDVTSLLGTANFPEQGAKYDPVKKAFDINKPLDSYSYPTDCWGAQKPFSDCVKGANAFMLDNEVKFMFFYQSPDQAAKENKNLTTGTYVDLAEISALQQRPVNGTTYDATAKTFAPVNILFPELEPVQLIPSVEYPTQKVPVPTATHIFLFQKIFKT